MFVSEKITFIELHKTGCTHIRQLLMELVGGELRGKHNQLTADLDDGARYHLGSIRNPWEWYLSLWAYGCDGKGAVFGSVTKNRQVRGIGWRSRPLAAARTLLSGPNRHRSRWLRVYRAVNDFGAFREWLHMVHSSEFRDELGEGYGDTQLATFAGLLTFRYITLFTLRADQKMESFAIGNRETLAIHEKENCFIDYFIRNESLEPDLLLALSESGISIPAGRVDSLAARPRTNVSSRSKGIEYYYDEKCIRLVQDRDKLILDRFGYSAEA